MNNVMQKYRELSAELFNLQKQVDALPDGSSEECTKLMAQIYALRREVAKFLESA